MLSFRKRSDPIPVGGKAGKLLFTYVAEPCQHLAIDQLPILQDGEGPEPAAPVVELSSNALGRKRIQDLAATRKLAPSARIAQTEHIADVIGNLYAGDDTLRRCAVQHGAVMGKVSAQALADLVPGFPGADGNAAT